MNDNGRKNIHFAAGIIVEKFNKNHNYKYYNNNILYKIEIKIKCDCSQSITLTGCLNRYVL
jgi:hypothetical protein